MRSALPSLETGINWHAVEKEMAGAEWCKVESDREERQVFLGTVFQLTPSGKFYMPFACGNVAGCPQCKGAGAIYRHKNRVRKKAHKRIARERERAERLRARGIEVRMSAWWRSWKKMQRIAYGESCGFCGGLGSREAHLDEIWREKLEAEAEEYGFYIASGEGDPCDIFASESRDVEETEETIEE